MLSRILAAALLVLSAATFGCVGTPPDDRQGGSEELGETAQALVGYDCGETQANGYSNGVPTPITVVTVDGKPVEIDTANAFLTMAQAAENDGIELHISSGFRTEAEQQYYYNCYINCNCNSCSVAAAPGYSNHQSGHALDLNTYAGGVYGWLNAHGSTYGFKRTVASEAWHWEWWGAGVTPTQYCSTSCDRTAGGFTFSCDGANSGLVCTSVDEPADPDSWSDNYFCSDTDQGIQWSHNGPIEGMVCTNVNEAAENHAADWSDNFICVPEQSAFRFQWSSAGTIAGMSCVNWNEPGDTHSWSDNYLCQTGVSTFTNAPFTFSDTGAPAGKVCVNVDEPADPDTWSDNFFCSDDDLGMVWSHAGTVDGMVCTNVTEASDPQASDWADNFICLPPLSPYVFTWSSAGTIAGKSCVRWYEGADLKGTWNDNWLCFEPNPALNPPSQGTGGGGGGDGSGSTSGSASSDSDANPPSSSDPASSGCSTSRGGGSSESIALFAILAVTCALRTRSRRSTST